MVGACAVAGIWAGELISNKVVINCAPTFFFNPLAFFILYLEPSDLYKMSPIWHYGMHGNNELG